MPVTLPTDMLIPPAGLSREIGLLVAGLEEVRAQTVELLSDLSNAELCARPFDGAHQIGSLALHLAKNEYWWIQIGYANRSAPENESHRFFLEDDTLDADFRSLSMDASDCIALLAAAHACTLTTLTGVDDTELEMMFENPKPDPEYRSSLRWIIHHLIDHEAHHKGQISMLKRLIRSRS